MSTEGVPCPSCEESWVSWTGQPWRGPSRGSALEGPARRAELSTAACAGGARDRGQGSQAFGGGGCRARRSCWRCTRRGARTASTSSPPTTPSPPARPRLKTPSRAARSRSCSSSGGWTAGRTPSPQGFLARVASHLRARMSATDH